MIALVVATSILIGLATAVDLARRWYNYANYDFYKGRGYATYKGLITPMFSISILYVVAFAFMNTTIASKCIKTKKGGRYFEGLLHTFWWGAGASITPVTLNIMTIEQRDVISAKPDLSHLTGFGEIGTVDVAWAVGGYGVYLLKLGDTFSSTDDPDGTEYGPAHGFETGWDLGIQLMMGYSYLLNNNSRPCSDIGNYVGPYKYF